METISNTAIKVHYHLPILVNHKNSTKQETFIAKILYRSSVLVFYN